MGVVAWVVSAVALAPIVYAPYAPYAPLATLRFEVSSPTADAVATGAMILAWVAATAAVVWGWRRDRDSVGAMWRAVILGCSAVWIALTMAGLRDEAGPTPSVIDSPLYMTHWATAIVALIWLTALAVSRRPLPAQSSLGA